MPIEFQYLDNGLPGWKGKNINGYSWRAYGELLHIFKENLSLSLLICAGHQHWEGSSWQTYKQSQVKWPDDTYSVSSFLSFNWNF